MSTATVDHKKEITGIILLACALFLGPTYYLPQNIFGVLGEVLHDVGRGILGVGVFALPVLFVYIGIELFIEKRERVAPRRIRHVLFLSLTVLSLLHVLTIDYEGFSRMCVDDALNGPLASNAFVLLYQSGIDPKILQTGAALYDWSMPGGVIGGMIALAMMSLAARWGAVVILSAFIVSQIVLIFNISLSRTAQKTAKMIQAGTHRATDALRHGADHLRERNEQAEKDGRNAPSFETITLKDNGKKGSRPSFSGITNDADPFDLNLDRNDKDYAVEDHVNDPFNSVEFSSSSVDPMPLFQGINEKDYPDFLRQDRQADTIDLSGENKAASPHVRRIGANGQLQELPLDKTKQTPPDRAKIDEPISYVPVARKMNTPSSAGRQLEIKYPKPNYKVAPVALLRQDNQGSGGKSSKAALTAQGKKLEKTLASFGVQATVVNITHGPAITRFELTPGPGIKVSRIVNLTDDLALAMASVGVRIEAPIPGKSAIGIEIPNAETSAVSLKSLIDNPTFRRHPSPLLAALGRDIPGHPIFCDVTKTPHLLIAGATGSGKSVCINSILISILCKSTPQDVRMIMIDPKVVELSMYNGIPHLLAPVVTDPKKAANTLNWAVGEMIRRYGFFAEHSVRDFHGYNDLMRLDKEETLPLILIVIDELADLMQVASKEVEEAIARLTAMARAAGIHLLIATQRPSVDVITGVIKSNIPSRIAFAVSSQVDSRTILDIGGAEKLLGKGDMLYYPQSAAKPQRGQGAFVSDQEVEAVIDYLKAQHTGTYDPEQAEAIISAGPVGPGVGSSDSSDEDELLPNAVEIILSAGQASVSILQRRMNIGYPRAARLIDRMEDKGYVGSFEGSKPRKLLITKEQWLEIQARGGKGE